MNIQWYPGHMTKARRAMQEDIRLIDLIIELVDARAPLSSRNPDLDELGKGKARMILLNKADLADERANKEWLRYFESQGLWTVRVDSRSRADLKQIQPVIGQACKEKTERDRRRGILNRPIRAMVVGIPNVGKSTFINSFAGKAAAKTGDRPGVTKGNQWIRLNKQVELLDTPGILWPKFDDQQVGMRLAFLGSISDTILNSDELAVELLMFLIENRPELLEERYGAGTGETGGPLRQAAVRALEQIAAARACLMKGGGYDLPRAAKLLIDDFRSGRLGRITLEWPDETTRREQDMDGAE